MFVFIKRRPAVLLAWLVGALVLGVGSTAYFRNATPAKKPAPATVPLVSVAVAQVRDLPLKLGAQGHLVALAQVDVRPQANGIIRSIHFKEGDEVKAGQLMFTIDATDVAAQLARAQANAAQTKAQLDEAQRDLSRTQQLAKSRFYSASAVDTSMSKVESLQAQHRAALADIENTRVLVDHTRIAAPMSGLTGPLLAHVGSLAQPGAATALVNVVQVDPIGVEFNLPEIHLSEVLAARANNNIQIALETPGGKTIEGKLVFINNTVNTDTGTISLKAAFPNAAKALWPGAYAKIQLVAGVNRGAVTLPPQSVLDGPKGKFVFVVDGQDKVASVAVNLLRMQDQLAIVEGLQGGEHVVSEGQLTLKTGMQVRVAKVPEPGSAVASASGSAP